MKQQRVWLVVLALLICGNYASTGARQRDDLSASQAQPTTQTGSYVKLTGQVVDIHGPRVFTIREGAGTGREWVVLAPRALSPGFKGATVTVEGTVRRISDADLKRAPAYRDLDEPSRARLSGRAALVATSVLAIVKGEPAPAMETPAPPARTEPALRVRQPVKEGPMALRASMLAANLEVFAGRQLRVLNGRVVGVLEPRAFLIEPATSYLKAMGNRDRMLVLIGSSTLRAPAELVVGSTVNVTGVARTIVGMQMTREVPWPAGLEAEKIERLEVRGVLLASSVQTPEGIELTNAPPAPHAAVR